MNKSILGLTLILFSGIGASAYAQSAPAGLAVVVNKSNSVESLSTAQLRKLVLGDVREWPGKKVVNVVLREGSSKVSQLVFANVVRLTEAEYRRYIMNAEFRGDEAMTVLSANSDAESAKQVAGAAGGIAFVELGALPGISSTVKVVRVNGKLPGEPGYPL
jgi:ABC-type phosphate transport system substrate-binding protein